ncbi:tRNA (adenosine(37)-N6)-dimethylallyltransferase MiaA [Hydrogenimonas sp. SS33]|uniref:tRNA (adenosine(37)-N6)-dimethylallyltransferase MiaA n=1 Tax=Hydrogenimonas leucolamina TaxID=2954236 RepID=UPI00336BF261
MKTLSILGPTASGKTDLALRLAKTFGAHILSLDSLAIYRHIDIASAKPTAEERGRVPHWGIDLLQPDEHFSAAVYIELYHAAKARAEGAGVPLIIVGGTGFYLKTLMEGISRFPPVDERVRQKVEKELRNLPGAYETLKHTDPEYAAKIAPTDRYRIGKGLELLESTGKRPSLYLRRHPPRPILEETALYEIEIDRERLDERIRRRTRHMMEAGLVDEVAMLEKRFGREPHPMKAIGIREVLDYFDAKTSLEEAEERIAIHTRQLAKRQRTFNATQFPPHTKAGADALYEMIARELTLPDSTPPGRVSATHPPL